MNGICYANMNLLHKLKLSFQIVFIKLVSAAFLNMSLF